MGNKGTFCKKSKKLSKELDDNSTANDQPITPVEQDTYDRTFYRLPKDSIVGDCGNLRKQMRKDCGKFGKKLKQKSFYKSLLLSRLPIIRWLFMEYNFKTDFIADLISGFTVGIMNLPQSMGYALLANLPPVNGLYISFFPLFIYTLFGTSKHLSIGAIAVVSLLSGHVIQHMSDNYKSTLSFTNTTGTNITDTDVLVNQYKVVVASSLAFLVGMVQMVMGLTGLGVITTYFSDSFISGYTSGSAIHVLTSQLKDLIGVKLSKKHSGAFNIPKTYYDLALKIPSANVATIIASAICVSYLIIFKQFLNPRIKKLIKIEFPSELLLVVGITIVSYFANLNDRFKIDIVKKIPTGMPSPKIPDYSLWGFMVKDAILIGIIAFSINVSLATIFGRKHKYNVEPTQELYAYGASNMFGAFFSCFPSASSLGRSSVMESSGGKTQIAAVFSSVIILFVILWIGPLFEPLPKACLASIIAVALKGLLFQCYDFVRLWRINKYEAINWMGTFLAVVLLDVDLGLLAGVVLSIILIIIKDQRIKVKNLIQYKEFTNYVNQDLIKLESNIGSNLSNIKIFKVQNALYFVNIESFKSELYKLYGSSPLDLAKDVKQKESNIHKDEEALTSTPLVSIPPCILMDMSAVTYVDTGAVKALLEIAEDYEKVNVKVYFCENQEHFIQILNNMSLIDKFLKRLFVTVHDAILHVTSKTEDIIKDKLVIDNDEDKLFIQPNED